MELTAGTFRAEPHDVVADDLHSVGMHLATGEREGRRLEDRERGGGGPREVVRMAWHARGHRARGWSCPAFVDTLAMRRVLVMDAGARSRRV
jgi:hypothetical protein